MKNRSIRLTLLLLLFAGSTSVFAQGQALPRNLSLEQVIQMAQDKSPAATIARKNYESVYWGYKSFRSGLLPQVNLSLNTPGLLRSLNSITQPDGSQRFEYQNQAFSSAALSVDQRLPVTGGNLSISSSLNRLDIFGDNGYEQWSSSPLVISLSQPLFGYNSLKWEKKLQPLQFRLAEKRYIESLEDVAINITGRYFDVYIASIRLENTQFNEAINDTIFLISQGRYRVGKIAENELLQTELAYLRSKSEVQQAQLNLEQAWEDLAIALGMEPTDDNNLEPPQDLPPIEIETDFAISEARQNRSELIDFKAREVQVESDWAQARANSRFSANLEASYGLNQTGPSINAAYTQPLTQSTFGIGFRVPIFQWGRAKAQVELALANKQATEEQIKLDKRNFERNTKFQVMDFLQAQLQLEIAQKSDTIARRRFEVAKNRYLIGKIDITNLLIAQNERDNARSSYFQSLRQFWIAYYQLRRSTLYDFRNRQKLEPPRLMD